MASSILLDQNGLAQAAWREWACMEAVDLRRICGAVLQCKGHWCAVILTGHWTLFLV